MEKLKDKARQVQQEAQQKLAILQAEGEKLKQTSLDSLEAAKLAAKRSVDQVAAKQAGKEDAQSKLELGKNVVDTLRGSVAPTPAVTAMEDVDLSDRSTIEILQERLKELEAQVDAQAEGFAATLGEQAAEAEKSAKEAEESAAAREEKHKKRLRKLERQMEEEREAAEEKQKASRMNRRLADAQAAEVAAAVQQKLVAAAEREAALQARVATLEGGDGAAASGAAAAVALTVVEAVEHAPKASPLAEGDVGSMRGDAGDGALNTVLAARVQELEAAVTAAAKREEALSAHIEELEAETSKLEADAAVGAAEHEEKQQAARLQRRLADAQAAEVAAAVQAKLVAAA